ncbi:ABC transporter permease [Arthrobacter sp. H20]|uniref:ABC transporter permease n=1 Tax=Arthrobacter sp. H20 TaxID=1267981 RepID=UPI00047ED2AA|nr:ABC transporter permease [Arthrobacter sp. H20]
MTTIDSGRPAGPARNAAWRPNTLALGGRRAITEIKAFNRDGLALTLILFFPVVMMALFGTVFGDDPTFGPPGAMVTPAQYYFPGMVALGTILSGFQNLSGYVAADRFNGGIKRLAGTPLPVVSYFIGKMGLTLYLIVGQTTILMLGSSLLLGIDLPTSWSDWLTVAWLLLAATAAWAVVGIAFACLAKSAESASTLAVLPVLILSFISGVYFQFTGLPEWLQSAANLTPLRWTASGMRSVFLPPEFEFVEPGQTWAVGMSALVIGIWLVVGLVLTRLTFKWPPQK